MIDRLEVNGDWSDIFIKDEPQIVAQQIKTRLLLWLGEFFLDTSDGTPYEQDILGRGTNYDLEIQERILNTPQVVEIISYSSVIDPKTRKLSVSATINTSYGVTTISTAI